MFLLTKKSMLFLMSLNPYSNGTMYLIQQDIVSCGLGAGVLILILMEQCI